MSVGKVFLIFALLLFFFAAIGVGVIPHPEQWGFVALAAGILTDSVGIPWRRATP